MSANEAGALHAPGYGSVATVPAWLRPPDDVNVLLPEVWAETVRRNPAGALEVGGVDVRDLAAQYGTPVYVLDEADFRARAAAPTSTTRARRSCAPRWPAGWRTTGYGWMPAPAASWPCCSGPACPAGT